jgi:hypothetical protein
MVFDGVPTPRDLERARKRFALLDRASQQWYAFNFSKWFADLPLSDR